MQFHEGFLLGIKAELFIMEDCWYQPMVKGVVGKVFLGRLSTVLIHIVYESPDN